MNVNLGEDVGYSCMFENCTSSKTIIKYITHKSFLQEIKSDFNKKNLENDLILKSELYLDDYSCILIDEIHERTLDGDILMAYLKEIITKRSDLKIVIMANILDSDKFQDYFEDATLLTIPENESDPIHFFFSLKNEDNYFEASIRTFIQIHMNESDGVCILKKHLQK